MKGALFRKGTPLIGNVTFEEIVSKYKPIIPSQMKKLGIYKNHEHFYQQGLIGLWEAYKQYDASKGKFQTLAITIVRGKMIDELKRDKLNEDRYVQVDFQENEDLRDVDVVVEEVLVDETIDAYCSELTPEQRLWIQKAIIEQKKPGEIAQELNIPVSKVKDWRKEALKKLRKKYRDGSRLEQLDL